jgi:putative DNA primase/helicase
MQSTASPSAHVCTTPAELREWLQGLKWDGTPRLNKWLPQVLATAPQVRFGWRQRWYLELIGRYIVLAHVARAMNPGCKLDCSIVLDGPGGTGKSRLVRTLVGNDLFSDEHFNVRGNAGAVLQGLWAYELAELDSFRRVDREAIKALLTSNSDRYRAPYARQVEAHPRQCVIWCTTSSARYLQDEIGNRRFWPVHVPASVDIDWLEENRAQLFAEATQRFMKGESYTPSRLQEILVIEPEYARRVRQEGGVA